MSKFLDGLGKVLETVSPAIPVVGGIASNILEGMNTRKARTYNTPVNQVKRLREAGLPMAAGSNISASGGFQSKTQSLGTENVPSNIGTSIGYGVQRKQIDLLKQQIRSGSAAADLAEHERNNKLNPVGIFEPTNQGTTMRQEIQAGHLANQIQGTIAEFMPREKNMSLWKNEREIQQMGVNMQKTIADIRNATAQHDILISEGNIKRILAEYQERMSRNELENLIQRTTGIKKQNALTDIAIGTEMATQLAKIQMAYYNATTSGEQVKAAQLANLLATAQLPSTQNYYKIRAGFDEAVLKEPNMINSLIYLSLFQPGQSNFNFGNLQNMAGYHLGNYQSMMSNLKLP